eukprot:scaffold12125_cov63-Skeletonema_menzelii.AAC.1
MSRMSTVVIVEVNCALLLREQLTTSSATTQVWAIVVAQFTKESYNNFVQLQGILPLSLHETIKKE